MIRNPGWNFPVRTGSNFGKRPAIPEPSCRRRAISWDFPERCDLPQKRLERGLPPALFCGGSLSRS